MFPVSLNFPDSESGVDRFVSRTGSTCKRLRIVANTAVIVYKDVAAGETSHARTGAAAERREGGCRVLRCPSSSPTLVMRSAAASDQIYESLLEYYIVLAVDNITAIANIARCLMQPLLEPPNVHAPTQ